MDRTDRYSRISFERNNENQENIELKPHNLLQVTEVYDSSISTSEDRSEDNTQSLNTHWTPAFLRIPVLLSLTIFFAVIVVALQVVFNVSNSNDGIATSNDDKHFLWTYAPTALFMLVTVVWRQIDYAAKSIQPWANMAKGPQRAESSLLLNYITPFQLVSLWKSLACGHWNVFSSITVFMLIKVIMVVSTGLFSLHPIHKDGIIAPMQVSNTFDGTKYHIGAVDSRAAMIVYGGLQHNITLPLGTTEQFVVQSFEPTGDVVVNSSLTYSATVDVFSAGLTCVSGKLNTTHAFDQTQSSATAAYYNTTVTLPDCDVHGAYLDTPDWRYAPGNTTQYLGYRASIQAVECANLPLDDIKRYRYMIASTYSRGTGMNEFSLLRSANVVCLPAYYIQPAFVKIDTQGNVQSVEPHGETRELSGLNASAIADGVVRSSVAAATGSDSPEYEINLDPFTTIMRQTMSDFEATDLLDAAYLSSAGNEVYGRLAAQVASLNLLRPLGEADQVVVQGTLSKIENRLFAREIPLRIMQGLAAAAFLLTTAIMFLRPRGVMPRNTDSIAAIAAVLARSPNLECCLRGTGHETLEELEQRLAPHKYSTRVGYENGARSFAVVAHITEGTRSDAPHHDIATSQNTKWIRPFILRKTGLGLTFILSVAIILGLEIALYRAQANDGLASVDIEDTKRYVWTYVPVFVFLGLATLYNMMDFELEIADAFYALAKSECDAGSTMLWYPLRRMALQATYDGLKQSRCALLAGSAAALLAPLLTIIVSGLFFPASVSQSTSVAVDVLNWFKTTTLATIDTNVPLLVIEGNMSFPSWTYDEVALPSIALVNSNISQQNDQGASLSVDVPAIRAGVTCNVVPRSQILKNNIVFGYADVEVATPDGCGNSGSIDDPDAMLGLAFQVPQNISGYAGYSLTVGFEDNCPTIALFYGHVTDNHFDRFSAILCSQSLERVQTNVTFNLPDFSILGDPIVRDDSSTHFSDFRSSFLTLLPQLNGNATDDVLDSTFSAIVYGKDGVPTKELLDSNVLIQSYTHFYRRYMAQVVNQYLRANFSTLSSNASETVENPLQAIHTDPNHYRLKVSPLSTHLLAGIVGCLSICALIVFVTLDVQHVLTKPLGSIAAVASMLAGSSVVQPSTGLAPPGSEYWSDEDWISSGVWQNRLFRLGWWNEQREFVTSKEVFHDNQYATLPASFRIDARSKLE